MTHVSFPGYLTVMLVLLAVYIAFMMRTYASTNPRLFPKSSYPTIFLAYFCSLAIVLLVPLDASVTIVSRRSLENESDFEEKSRFLVIVYLTFFLITQVGYNGLTFQERYNKSGYFTVKSKIYDCCRHFAVLGTAGLVSGIIFFVILVTTNVVKPSFDAVVLTIVLLSNTGGLAVLMVLLGYGLVSFPQMLWLKGDLQRQLKQAQQRAASRYKDFSEVSLNMSMLCSTILKTENELKSHPSDNPEVNKAIDLIVKERPSEFKATTAGPLATDKDGRITIEALAKLRSRLYYLSSAYEMAQGKVEEAKVNAYHYEDILESINRSDGIKRIKWSFGPESTERGYNFYVYVKPIFFRILSILCMCMSIFCFLGVIGTMTGVGKSISVYATAIHDDNSSSEGICIFVIFTLLYPAYVTMWSIFQMRIARIMELLPGRRTTAPSLSVNSRAVIRLSTPLVFFYLGWVFENGIKDGEWLNGAEGGTVGDDDAGDNRIMMAFAKFYQVEVIPVLGGSFNTLFPIIMFSVSGLVLFNLFNRVLVYLKLEKFQFGAEILTEEQLREGQRQLTRHKRTMERAYQRKVLRQHMDGSAQTASPISGISRLLGLSVAESSKTTARDIDNGAGDIEQGTADQGINAGPPKVLEGWVEKKGQKKFGVSGGWQSRYFCVIKPGRLVYYKDSAMDGEPNGEVNLGLVMSFNLTTKDDGDKDDNDAKIKLELDLADKTFKMRFADINIATEWRDGLLAWKNYCIANSDDDYRHEKLSHGGMELSNIYSSEDTGSIDDETAALTKNLPSSSDDSLSYAISNPHNDFSMEISAKPPPLDGWLEKKQHSKFGKMAQWQKRYFKVDEDCGALVYFKSTNPNEPAAGSIDMRMIVDVAVAEKDGKVDAARFNIDVGDKIYKIRASSTAEGEHWISSLKLWRDYILLK